MIREQIISRMHDNKLTQVSLSKETGIEYTAINTFLNNKKGMWFGRVQKMLDHVGLSAEGSVPSKGLQGIQKAVWLELRCRNLNATSIAKDAGMSYGTLNGFINNKVGMSIGKVERLMTILGIDLVPYDRHTENRPIRRNKQN